MDDPRLPVQGPSGRRKNYPRPSVYRRGHPDLVIHLPRHCSGADAHLQGAAIRELCPERAVHDRHVPVHGDGLERPLLPSVRRPRGWRAGVVLAGVDGAGRVRFDGNRGHHHRSAGLPRLPREGHHPTGDDDRFSRSGADPPRDSLPQVRCRQEYVRARRRLEAPDPPLGHPDPEVEAQPRGARHRGWADLHLCNLR